MTNTPEPSADVVELSEMLIEPSDATRSEWDMVTEAYVAGLEQIHEAALSASPAPDGDTVLAARGGAQFPAPSQSGLVEACDCGDSAVTKDGECKGCGARLNDPLVAELLDPWRANPTETQRGSIPDWCHALLHKAANALRTNDQTAPAFNSNGVRSERIEQIDKMFDDAETAPDGLVELASSTAREIMRQIVNSKLLVQPDRYVGEGFDEVEATIVEPAILSALTARDNTALREAEVLERAIDRMGWSEIHAFQNELRKGQDVREDGGGFMIRAIKALFGVKRGDPVENYQQAARRMIDTALAGDA